MANKGQEFLDALLVRCPYFIDELPRATELSIAVVSACEGLFDEPPTADNLAKFMTTFFEAARETKKEELRKKIKLHKIKPEFGYELAKSSREVTEKALMIIEGLRLLSKLQANDSIFGYPEYVIFTMKLSDDPLISLRLSLANPKTVWELLLLEPAFFLPLSQK